VERKEREKFESGEAGEEYKRQIYFSGDIPLLDMKLHRGLGL
jgi:hypothetical protein